MFLALRDLRSAAGRFLLMGSVVALMTLLLVMLSGLTAGLGRESTSALTDLPAEHVVFAAAPGDKAAVSFAQSQVSADVLARWRTARPDASGLGIAQGRAQAHATTSVALFGVEDGSGLGPVAPSAGEVVVGRTVASDLGIDVGDPLTLNGTEVRVAALVDDAWYSHTPVIWTIQRTRDIAVLRALGASARYVLGDALAQAGLVLTGGVLAGGIVGWALGRLAAGAVPFRGDATTTLLPAAGVLALGLLGSLLAVRRVTTVDPLLALGGN